jgi:hypothetical protein
MASYGQYKESIIKADRGTDWFVFLYKKDYFDHVTNNTFINGLTGWVAYNSSLQSDGGLKLGVTANTSATLRQSPKQFVYNNTYYVTIKVKDSNGSFGVKLNGGAYTYFTGNGTHKAQITAGNITSGSATGVYISNTAGGGVYSTFTIESISVNETEYNTQDLDLSGEGFQITWNGQGSTRDRIFLGSECKLNCFIQDDDEESFMFDVLDGGFKDFFIRIYKDNTLLTSLWWYGYIQPSFDTIENLPYPYVCTLTATDSYGYYSKQDFKTFLNETDKQNNYQVARVFEDFFRNMDIAATNLVKNGNFSGGSSRGWEIKEADSVSANALTIDAATETGRRYPISCEGDVLVPGNTYYLTVSCTTYTTGTLYIKDGGGSSATIGTITGAGQNQSFNWTQSDNSTQSPAEPNGLHFWSDDFEGTIGNVIAYSTEDFLVPSTNDFMKINLDWNNSGFSSGVAKCSQFYICKGAFATNTNFPLEYKDVDAFNECLKIFNLVGFLAKGEYYFIQPNSFVDNSSNIIKYSPFDRTTQIATVADRITETNLVTIDQSNEILLGGSTFTFEAPFRSVSATYTSVNNAFELAKGDNITDRPEVTTDDNYTYGGQIIEDQIYTLDWFSIYTETTPTSNFTLGTGFSLFSGIQNFDSFVTIKAVSSSSTKYLTVNADDELEWVSNEKQIVLSRGLSRVPGTYSPYNSLFSKEFNDSTFVGSIKNAKKFQERDGDIIKVKVVDSDYVTTQDLRFNCQLPTLSETSTIFVKVYTETRYQKQKTIDGIRAASVTNSNLVDKDSVVESVTLTVKETNSLDTNEARYTEYSTGTTAVENYDLGDVIIGVTETDTTFSITDRDNIPITSNIYRDGNTSGQEPFTQFLTKEFLELQKSPLKILQGSIESTDISPIDIVKYSLNDDGVYEYYMFLGGTFNAKSEIMDGEWFRLKSD